MQKVRVVRIADLGHSRFGDRKLSSLRCAIRCVALRCVSSPRTSRSIRNHRLLVVTMRHLDLKSPAELERLCFHGEVFRAAIHFHRVWRASTTENGSFRRHECSLTNDPASQWQCGIDSSAPLRSRRWGRAGVELKKPLLQLRYPCLSAPPWLLSKLYQFIKPAIFCPFQPKVARLSISILILHRTHRTVLHRHRSTPPPQA